MVFRQTDFYDFSLIRQIIPAGRAVRARHVGSFGQRGPWAYALYSSDTTLAIDSFAADNTEVESGDTVTLTWTMRNATSASIDQGVGALSASQLESGSVQVNPTATTTYTLTATDGSDTVDESVTVTVTDPLTQPSITSFAPDDATLTPTQTTTVRWVLVNVVSGMLNGTGLNRNLTSSELISGSADIGPLAVGTYSYRITVAGAPGTTPPNPRTFNVTVSTTPPPPPDPVTIDSFTVDDSTIESGGLTTLRWQTSNADSVTLNGSTVSADGSEGIAPSSTTTYTLRATGPGGPVTRTVTVTVTEPPDPVTIDSFTADDHVIELGESTVLRWTTSNATVVRLDGSVVSADGSMSVSPTSNHIYELIATGPGGPVSDTTPVEVTDPPDPDPNVVSFSASSSTINSGDSVVISWVTANGDTRELISTPPQTTYMNQAASGSRTFTLTVTTQFQIQVWNAVDPAGTLDNAFVTVTVN